MEEFGSCAVLARLAVFTLCVIPIVIPIPDTAANNAKKVRYLAELEPPAQYNHPYNGPVVERVMPVAAVRLLCMSRGADPGGVACSWQSDGACYVALPDELRLRRLKAELIATNAHKGLQEILEPLSDCFTSVALSQAWAKRDPDAIKQVDEILASADLTMDAVMARALEPKLDQVERIDRMIMSAEARRNAALRELDRHRASLAQALRRATDNIEDAQFREIGVEQIVDRNAA